jgi:acetyl esterase/lipase
MAKSGAISKEAGIVVAELEAAGITVPTLDSLAQYRADTRASYESHIEQVYAGFDGEIKGIEIAGVPCKQLTPSSWEQRDGLCIQYAYGGGYVSGSCYEDLIIAVPLAQYCNARVVMVDYRLSPEHPYPAPQQDMRDVYPILLDVYGPEHLVVAGESAGGNQALGLLHHVRDNGLLSPACAALLSPWCDLADSELADDGLDPTLSRAWIETAAAWHAGDAALDDPGLSPLYADMDSLPPTFISTGSRDLLQGMCVRLAEKMQAAGVSCELRVHDGMWHVFEFYPIPEAQQSLQEIAAFIETQTRAAISRLT